MSGQNRRAAGRLALLGLIGATALAARAQSGCSNGSVFLPLGFNGTIKLCPEYNSRIPELQKQLDAVQKTLAGNQVLLAELQHSVRSINSVAKDVDEDRKVELLHSFERELLASVTADQQRTQAQIASLSGKLDALQEMIAAKKDDEKTSQQMEAALAGQLGDAIAALDLSRAKSQLDSIEAKLDTIASDVKCSSATAEDMRLALKARKLDRVKFILECRPEIASDEESWHVAAQLFLPQNFVQSQGFLETLWQTPLLSSDGVCPAAEVALDNNNLDGMEWILKHSPAEKVQRCEKFDRDLTQALYRQCALGCSEGKEHVQTLVAGLKAAGLNPQFDGNRLFRLAYQDYLVFALMQTPGVARSPAQEFPEELSAALAIAQRETFFGPRYIGYWENQGFKWQSDAFAPPSEAEFRQVKQTAEAETHRRYPWVFGQALARMRMAEYCPQGRSYCGRIDPASGKQNEIFRDPQTGLAWTVQASRFPLAWDDAKDYCSGLNLDGHHDWRLPHLEELQNLYDPTQSAPAECPWLEGNLSLLHVRKGIQAGCNGSWSDKREPKTGKMGDFTFDTAWTFNFVSGQPNSWKIDWMGYEEPSQALCVRGTVKAVRGKGN